MSKLIPEEIILTKVYRIRGHKVMVDRDLAQLYGVETKVFNQAVRRNEERFPNDFRFQLTWEEVDQLRATFSRSQFVTLKRGKNIKYLPFVFTEQGIAMLSSVLRSKRAIEINILIMRVFVKLREIMMTHKDLAEQYKELRRQVDGHDKMIMAILEAMKGLQGSDQKERKSIGFHV